jgi:hypothetical protein
LGVRRESATGIRALDDPRNLTPTSKITTQNKNKRRHKNRVKVYNARLALILFYNARPVLNARNYHKKNNV